MAPNPQQAPGPKVAGIRMPTANMPMQSRVLSPACESLVEHRPGRSFVMFQKP